MDVPELASQLRDDAVRAVPPFGAASVGLARRLGPAVTDFLLGQVRARGDTAFVALEALRAADPVAYAALPATERAEVYADALRHSAFFNAWGVPGYHLTPTADALIALGEPATAALAPLLADRRRAPLSGSQDATTGAMYGNRVRDYVWVLICAIDGRPYRYSQDPAERDRHIDALRHEFEGRERRA